MKSPIEMMLDGVEWVSVQSSDPETTSECDRLPVATHRGVLKLGAVEMECFRLDNGMAVISEKGMEDFLNWLSGGHD